MDSFEEFSSAFGSNLGRVAARFAEDLEALSEADAELVLEIGALQNKPEEIRGRFEWLFAQFDHPNRSVRDSAILRVREIAREDPGVVDELVTRTVNASDRTLAEIAHTLGYCPETGQRAVRALVALMLIYPHAPEVTRRAAQALNRLDYEIDDERLCPIFLELARALADAARTGKLSVGDLEQIRAQAR